MKKALCLIMACLFLGMMFTACGSSKLVGEWDAEGATVILNKDGTGTIGEDGLTLNLEWEVKKGELIIAFDILGEKVETVSEYSLRGKKLILTSEDGEKVIWTKK